MSRENATYVYIGALVRELTRAGVRHLCLCPGSRSTPLALCAAREPGMKVWTLIDERSAGFFALGMARALRVPVALLSTSGTAAANFLPAVVEARYSRVPLLVLTADRPHEVREAGAPQTIDQLRLYGPHAKWFMDMAIPEATDLVLRYVRTVASQAVVTAQEDPAGPVHLNFPLREPLVPLAIPGELPPPDQRFPDAWEGRPQDRPYVKVTPGSRHASPDHIARLTRTLRDAPHGIIVCGPCDMPAFPAALTRLAAAAGYPVLADPLSQVRCGPHDRGLVIDSYDPMLRVEDLAARLAPQVVLRFGGVPASKPLAQYLERHRGASQILVGTVGGWTDPSRLACEIVHADPIPVCEALTAALGSSTGDPSWAEMWRRLGTKTREVLGRRLAGLEELFEGKVFSELAGLLPEGAVLYAGNSMPVRDLDSFLPATRTAIRMLGNRGASGIDGLVSSALGVAAAGEQPVVLVLGDLAFYHDLNGLLAAKLHALRATIVVINNDGGGIFSFLPQAAYPDHFEELFGTPHGLDFRHAAEMYGATFTRVQSWQDFRTGLQSAWRGPGLGIIEVRTTRDRNVALHREMWAAVEAALREEMEVALRGMVR